MSSRPSPQNNDISPALQYYITSPIPENGWVLSIDSSAQGYSALAITANASASYTVTLTPQGRSSATTSQNEWAHMDHIVGGTPMLISNKTPILDFTEEQTIQTFLTNRHPRTAVGILENKDWIFVVVDGGPSNMDEGMTIAELTEYMAKLGCIKALNMDGGGSSTMVLNGRVVNHAHENSGEEQESERRVGDAILIKPLH